MASRARKKLGQCSLVYNESKTQCHRNATYRIGIQNAEHYHSVHEGRKFDVVCATHDKFIGRRNMVVAGWSQEEAIKLDRNPDYTPLK
jgi:hypothetical protein